jgi:hypothetical protein
MKTMLLEVIMQDDNYAQNNEVKFPLGRVVATAHAAHSIPPDEIFAALSRHAQGDWGDVCDEDRKENELSLRQGFRLLSIYRSQSGLKFWIITEADRSVTTVLLPEDY